MDPPVSVPIANGASKAATAAAEKRVEFSPFALAVVVVGAGVMFVAAFLPFAESSTFFRIAKNTLIQQGGGWVFIAVAVMASTSTARRLRGIGLPLRLRHHKLTLLGNANAVPQFGAGQRRLG